MFIVSDVVVNPGGKNLCIMNDGKKSTLQNLYLSAFMTETNQLRVPPNVQRDVLRRDADVARLYKDEVQCKGCMRLLRIAYGSDSAHAGKLTIIGWLEHKLRCGDLQ